jgi:hypothetical protein
VGSTLRELGDSLPRQPKVVVAYGGVPSTRR